MEKTNERSNEAGIFRSHSPHACLRTIWRILSFNMDVEVKVQRVLSIFRANTFGRDTQIALL